MVSYVETKILNKNVLQALIWITFYLFIFEAETACLLTIVTALIDRSITDLQIIPNKLICKCFKEFIGSRILGPHLYNLNLAGLYLKC